MTYGQQVLVTEPRAQQELLVLGKLALPKRPLLQALWTVPLEELYQYDFSDPATAPDNLSVRCSTLMDYLCGVNKVSGQGFGELRPCYLDSKIDETKLVTLSFWYMWLESNISYFVIQIQGEKIRYKFFFGRVPHPTKEVHTFWIRLDSEEFIAVLWLTTKYLLSWDDDILIGYIEHNQTLANLEQEESEPAVFSF